MQAVLQGKAKGTPRVRKNKREKRRKWRKAETKTHHMNVRI